MQKSTKSVGAVVVMAKTGSQTPPSGEQKTPRSSGKEGLGGWYALAGVGFEFIVAVLLFGGLGWWLDGLLGAKPWLMVSGLALGFATGLWLLIKAARRTFHD